MPSVEIRSGALAPLFERLAAEALARTTAGVVATANAVERQAKMNASNGRHPYRTATPSPGDPEGPAIISATLVDSIVHTQPVVGLLGVEVQVGMSPGHFPYYRPKGPPSSRYAYYLEVTGAGKSRHRFPFLVPALHMAGHIAVYTAFRQAFAGGWG